MIEAWAGVRPLFDDGHGDPSAVTRDYVLELDAADGAPLLNVFGGKITTFRRLAEHALQKLKPFFPAAGGDWTAAGDAARRRDRRWRFRAVRRSARRRISVPADLRSRATTRACTAPARRSCSGPRLRSPTSAAASARISMRCEARYLVAAEWARNRRRRHRPAHQARAEDERRRARRVCGLVAERRRLRIAPRSAAKTAGVRRRATGNSPNSRG